MKWFNLILIVLIVGFFSYLFSGEIGEAVENKFGKNEQKQEQTQTPSDENTEPKTTITTNYLEGQNLSVNFK